MFWTFPTSEQDDNILVTGKDDQEHISNLEAVLQKLQEHQLKIKLSKCCFFQDSVEYLGKVVSKQGISTSEKNWSNFKNVTS